MAKRQNNPTKAVAAARPDTATESDPDNLIPAPRIRKLVGGISAMTFWRWRRAPDLACPPLTEINGRLYGGERAWLAWRENQKRRQQAA